MERRDADVCVVGAGFAGLAAARRLAGAGRSVVVLEARDRVGGRVWNRRLSDGTTVSVGGTWLGQRQTRMVELCRAMGLDTYAQYDRGDTLLRLDGANHRYTGLIPRIGPFALLSLGWAFKRLDRMVDALPLDAPWDAAGAGHLDRRTLGEWISSRYNVPSARARLMVHTMMTMLFNVDPSEVSLLGSLVLAKGGGSFEYYADNTITETTLVDGGSPELARRLGAELGEALHLSAPVRRIARTRDHVDVTADPVTVRARHVIVATPPVLAGHIEYEPALPPACGHLLRRMVAGAIIRGITVYDEPFWRHDGLTGETVAPQTAVPVTIDQSPRSGTPGILSSYAVGADAVKMARLDPTTRREVWLKALAERLGDKALRPVAYQETDWSTEQWSQGGMIAHFAPGVLTTYRSALREPVGRIHWAGAERATLMHGLMEGAVRSGEHAADAVLASEEAGG